ncbi:MAG: hypothetical protein ACKOXK_00085 [Chakrabartia sp.]
MKKFAIYLRRFFYIPLLVGSVLIEGDQVLTDFARAMLIGMLTYDIFIEVKKRLPER